MARSRRPQNKITNTILPDLALAFQHMDGVDAMTRWANKSPSNRTFFYAKIYTKLLTIEPADAEPNMQEYDEAREGIQRLFGRIIAATKETENAAADDAEPGSSRDTAAGADGVPR
jgi:hypothetical protein